MDKHAEFPGLTTFPESRLLPTLLPPASKSSKLEHRFFHSVQSITASLQRAMRVNRVKPIQDALERVSNTLSGYT